MSSTDGTIATSHHQIARPPTPFTIQGKSIFLAGSMTPDWQSKLTALLFSRMPDKPLTVLNPRRDDWDSSWKESISFAPFREQVEWELSAQEAASVIAFYFSPETEAPVSLLELGLNAGSGKVVVYCPEGYWKKGNVEVVCARNEIKLFEDIEDFEAEVVRRLQANSVINREIPSSTVYETEQVIVILDIMPLRRGHILAIPKHHCSRLSDLPPDYAGPLGEAISKVANALTLALDNTALNVVCNQEYAQAVPHVHYHIIPAPRLNAPVEVKRTSTTLSHRAMHQAEFEKREELDDYDAEMLVKGIRAHL
ncbi:hypothetical protein ONZ45_g290 [Pleurotus djamor]|nr:hypothetical protein ONZ45_g290 [Pleurotus djamor]